MKLETLIDKGLKDIESGIYWSLKHFLEKEKNEYLKKKQINMIRKNKAKVWLIAQNKSNI